MAARQGEIYKCLVCGIVAEMLEGGAGEPVCCGRPMTLQIEKTAEQGKEKHVPILLRDGRETTVKVGSVPHPMEDKHWIQWIELQAGPTRCRRYLRPNELPQASFPFIEGAAARAFCNLHGLWESA